MSRSTPWLCSWTCLPRTRTLSDRAGARGCASIGPCLRTDERYACRPRSCGRGFAGTVFGRSLARSGPRARCPHVERRRRRRPPRSRSLRSPSGRSIAPPAQRAGCRVLSAGVCGCRTPRCIRRPRSRARVWLATTVGGHPGVRVLRRESQRAPRACRWPLRPDRLRPGVAGLALALYALSEGAIRGWGLGRSSPPPWPAR